MKEIKTKILKVINPNTGQYEEINAIQGAKGQDGYTPVRGKDYWTDADKSEIKTYVDDAILRGVW